MQKRGLVVSCVYVPYLVLALLSIHSMLCADTTWRWFPTASAAVSLLPRGSPRFSSGSAEGSDSTGSFDLEWSINTSSIFPGLIFGSGHRGCQTAWDTDGDGVTELLFATRRGHSKRLWCFDSRQIFEWVYPPVDQDGLPGDPTSKVSLVDVDNNDIYEICFGGRGGRLHVLDGAGHALWTWDDPNPDASISGPPQALDIDQDGFVEFLIADSQGFIYCVNHAGHDGDDLWVLRVEGGGNEAQPTICDIDRDDEYEVLWAGLDGTLHCIDALHGDEEWSFRTGGAMPANPVVVMDINSDREYEAIVWNDAHVSGGSPQPGAVLCVNCFGQEVWRWTHPKAGGGLKLCQALGDTDLDGSMNMVIMSTLGMFCLDIGGESPATKWEINLGDWVEKGLLPAGAASNDYSAYQLIADIDGDSDLEILWLAPFPIVTDGSTGELEACFVNEELDLGGRQENGGWWGDLDRDGRSEWICELKGESHRETQLYCLTMKGVFPAWSPWPEYYHSAYPAEYQREQEWLVMDSAYSNSLWFPILESPELPAFFLILASILVPRRRPSCLIPHVCR